MLFQRSKIEKKTPKLFGDQEEVEAPKSSLKQKLFGYSEPDTQDDLGVTVPGERHEGIASKVIQYGLPALFGITSGVGALPALASTFAARTGAKRQAEATETDQYYKNRKSAMELLKEQNDSSLEKDKFGELVRHNKAIEGIASEKDKGLVPELEEYFSKQVISKTAPKLSILNSLKSTLSEYNKALESGDDAAAYAIGQRALKVINSPEGADAIGAEESKRLGSQLNLFRKPFAIPGDYFGVGRKLPEFGQSLKDTINILDKATQNSIQQAKNPKSIFNPRDSGYSDEEIDAAIQRKLNGTR